VEDRKPGRPPKKGNGKMKAKGGKAKDVNALSEGHLPDDLKRPYSSKRTGQIRRKVREMREEMSSQLHAPSPSDDLALSAAVDAMLRRIEELRRETHTDDEEMARLRQQTRNLIDEMMRDLNLKAA
jgi:hypothetical protein